MNKILTTIIIPLLTFTLLSCSYEPIFKEKNYNFEIETITLTGEKDTNKIIKNKLNLIKKSNNNIKRKFDVTINSKKKRKIISKDSQGDPLKFDLILTVDYIVKEKNKLLLNRKIIKQYSYDNDTDKFKLEQKESIILENLSEQISTFMISSIINLNDS